MRIGIMSVVNCKVAFIRPKYQNLKEWVEDERNAYIGRAGVVFVNGERFPKKASVFCNPFKISKTESREQVIERYRKYIMARLEKEHELRNQLQQLKGKRLGCWCHPEPCHGDVLLSLIE